MLIFRRLQVLLHWRLLGIHIFHDSSLWNYRLVCGLFEIQLNRSLNCYHRYNHCLKSQKLQGSCMFRIHFGSLLTHNLQLSSTSSQSHAKKRSAEMNFLKQACLQAFVFVCELITYFLITPRVDGSERWLRFFLSTVAWVCVHMLDGLANSASFHFTDFYISESSLLVSIKNSPKPFSVE